MKDITQIIYEIALEEMPHSVREFTYEDVIFFRGFRISKHIDGYYEWYDTRHSNYYEIVDPDISDRVLQVGFEQTITEVMVHTDKRKIVELNREIERMDAIVSYWVKESSKLWPQLDKGRNKVFKNKKTSKDEVKKRVDKLVKKFEDKKALYQKKRRVILEEKEVLKRDKKFYEARQILYSNFKFKH